MNQQYSSLFKLIAQTMENTAEMAMEQNKEKGDLEGYKTAQEMRDDYARIKDELSSNENYIPDKADIAKILVGANVAMTNIDARIKRDKKALRIYDLDLVPKLKKALAEPEKIEEIFAVKV